MKTKFTFLLVAGLLFAAATQAQPFGGYHANREVVIERHELNADQFRMGRDIALGNVRALHHDRFDYYQDRRVLRHDLYDRSLARHRYWDYRQHRYCY